MTDKKGKTFTGLLLLIIVILSIVLGLAVYTSAPHTSHKMSAIDGNSLPELASNSENTIGADAVIRIHFSDFNRSGDVPEYVYEGKDGDTIVCLAMDNWTDPGTVKFRIGTGKNVTWWKGLSLEASDGRVFRTAGINCPPYATEETTFTVSTSDLKGKTLVLSKAKFLGVHSKVYAIDDTETSFAGGYEYYFMWVKD